MGEKITQFARARTTWARSILTNSPVSLSLSLSFFLCALYTYAIFPAHEIKAGRGGARKKIRPSCTEEK